jgi:hypothetical protein
LRRVAAEIAKLFMLRVVAVLVGGHRLVAFVIAIG